MKLISEAINYEQFNKALSKAQDGIEKLRTIVEAADKNDFVGTQRTAIAYLLEDLEKINAKMQGK